MLHKVGYEVVYRDGAFKQPSYPSGTRRWNPLPDLLFDALELGKDAVLATSETKWIVIIMECVQHGFRMDDILAKVVVYVPADANQQAELLEALACFEEAIGEHLGLPVDTAYRSIEEGSPKCEDCESRTITWIRTTPNAGNERYFCNEHAERQSDFGGNAATNPDNFMYVRQHPHRVRING